MIPIEQRSLYPSRFQDERVQRTSPTGAVRQTRPMGDEPTPPSGSDARLVAQLLSAIVDASTIAQVVPIAAGIPKLIGVNPGRDRFSAFLDQLNQGITEISQLGGGLVAQPTPAGQPSGAGIQRSQRSLTAGLLGVNPNTHIRSGTPTSVRRFDDFAAAFSDAMTVEGAVADGLQDGLPPAAIELVGAMLQTIRNNLLMGDLQGARRAGTDAAAMIVAVWQALTEGEPAQRQRRQRAQPVPEGWRRVEGSPNKDHVVMDGHEPYQRRQRGGATITHRRLPDESEFEETGFAGQDSRGRPVVR